MTAAELVENGMPLTPELDLALHHGSPIGGARPKALIQDGDRKYIAKFSSTSDIYSVIKAEFIAMRLAQIVGLNVAPVKLERASSKDVLLVERFDRIRAKKGWQRKHMVSALTLFELDEMMARYASYEQLAETIRYRFKYPAHTLRELFQRMTFNILVGNTDDHARNHAAFWDGEMLSLTPAYDICPQQRTGTEANQAMLIHGENAKSQIATCLMAAPSFQLEREEALALVESQVRKVAENWDTICKEGRVSTIDQKLFANKQFLNAHAFENLDKDGEAKNIMKTVDEFRC
jgi:serine/threonine-protein kinase HipA